MIDVCNPGVIRELLARYGFHFSKSKGQNFLTQRWVPERIVQASGIDGSCGVVEIGPGFGPLTQELCLRAGKVVAIEVDQTLRPVLKETVGEFSNLEILFADALKTDLPALVAEKFPGLRPAACANLPYYITSPVLTKLLESRCFSSITVMVQKEVAQRICAAPASKDYSAFTVLCNYHAQPELLFFRPGKLLYSAAEGDQCRGLPQDPRNAARADQRRTSFLPHRARRLRAAPQNLAQRTDLRLRRAFQSRPCRRAGGLRNSRRRAR